MKSLLKIRKLEQGFLVEDEGGAQFAYSSLDKIANTLTDLLKKSDSKELLVTVETEDK